MLFLRSHALRTWVCPLLPLLRKPRIFALIQLKTRDLGGSANSLA
jgi:hypothetical protein